MKKSLFLLVAVLSIVATGCNKENLVTDNNKADESLTDVQYVSELKVEFGRGATRVGYTHDPESGLSFNWEDGEQIVVYENADAEALTFYYVYDASSNSFKPYNDSYRMVVGREYFAVRGVRKMSSPLSVEEGKTIVKMSVESCGKGLPGLPMISDVFTATAEGTIATMHHLCGVLEIPVKLKETATITEVTGFSVYVSSSKLGYNFTATPYAPYIVSTSEGFDTAYSEEKTYSLSKETATNVFVPVLPGTYENKAWLNYYYPGTSGQTGIGSNITIERGKITRFNDVLTINPW